MNLVILGLPGAGKGTQAKKISNQYNLPHISTGDIFRKAIREETKLGKKAKEFLDSGGLVPDEVTVGIVRDRLKLDDCNSGFILDGFPRTLNQAESLTKILTGRGEQIDFTLYIEVPESELISRLSGRRICQECGSTYHIDFDPPAAEGICDQCGGKLIQRSDDKEETVRNRIQTNKKELDELLSYYKQKGVLNVVNSEGGIEEVFTAIKDLIEANI